MPDSRSSFKKRRLRSHFLSLRPSEPEEHVRINELQEKDPRLSSLEKIENQLVNMGMTYILMRLPIDDNIENLENQVRKQIPQDIAKAEIREANEDDLETVLHLYNRAWTTSHTPLSVITLDALKQIHEYPETSIFLARYKGFDVGFIIIDMDEPESGIGTIEGLGVRPRFQNKGLGKVLGLAAWRHFKEKNMKELRCEVHEDNNISHDFIKSLGFKEYDRKVYRLDDFFIKFDTNDG